MAPTLTTTADNLPEVSLKDFTYSSATGFRFQDRPRLPESTLRQLLHGMTKADLFAQLTHYGISFKKSSKVGEIRTLLSDSIGAGKCRTPPPHIQAIEQEITDLYNSKNGAHLAEIHASRFPAYTAWERKLSSFKAANPDPRYSWSVNPELFLQLYFYDFFGAIDYDKAPKVMDITPSEPAGDWDLLKLTLHTNIRFASRYWEPNPDTGEDAFVAVIGVESSAVEREFEKLAEPWEKIRRQQLEVEKKVALMEEKAAKKRKEVEKLERLEKRKAEWVKEDEEWKKKIPKHGKLVKEVEKRIKKKGKNFVPTVEMAKGTYDIRFDELTEGWPDWAGEKMTLTIRDDVTRESHLDGGIVLGADFDFGVFTEGVSRIWLDGEAPEVDYTVRPGYRSDDTDDSDNCDDSDDLNDDGYGGNLDSSDSDSYVKFAQKRRFGLFDSDDSADDSKPVTKKARKNTTTSTAKSSSDKKTKLTTKPKKKKANRNTLVLHFIWRARSGGNSEIQLDDDQIATIEFTDSTYTVFHGRFEGSFVGESEFSGFKVSENEGKGTGKGWKELGWSQHGKEEVERWW